MKLTVWGGIVVAGTFLVAHPAQAQELNAISKVDVKVEGQKTTVVVTGSRRPTFQAYTQKAPPRVVLDLVKSTLVNLPPSTPQAKGQLLTEVRATQMGAAGRELARLRAGLIVDPGEHRIEVVRPGRESEEQTFSVRAGEEVRLDIELDEE